MTLKDLNALNALLYAT